MSEEVVQIDYYLALELTKSGICDLCKEPYLVNDQVEVKQNVRTRKGVAGHKRCWRKLEEKK